MKISIRIKILLLIHFLFYKKPEESPLVKIGSKGKGVKNILFFLPYQRKQAQVVAHLIKKNSNKKNYQIRYVVNNRGLFYYKEIPSEQIITYDDDDVNYFGVIKTTNIIKKIKNNNYNALVDLTNSYDQTLSILSLKLNIPIKMGFKSPISDRLYTVTIKPNKEGFIEENYSIIEKFLGLSN